MRDLLLAVVFFGVLPFALARPHWGLYLYSWISYMNPHRLAYGFAYSFPWAYLAALATLVGVLFSKEPKRMPWTREMTVLLLLALWWTFTTFFAFYPELAWSQWEKVMKIMAMIFITPLVINDRHKLRLLVWVIVLSLGFYGIKGGIFTIVHGGVYRVQGPMGSFIGGNNEIALALLMTIPLMRYLQLTEKHRLIRLGLTAAIVLTALAAIGSQSRGALVGAAVMATMFWWKSRNKFVTAILVVMAAGLIYLIMPAQWYERMQTIESYEEDASALGRINAWWTAYNVAKARITGGGFEMFQEPTFQVYAPEPDRVHDVHSVYFEQLGEHGFPALALWLLLGVLTWRTGSWVLRRVRKDPDKKWAADLAAMGQVTMMAYYAAGAFLGLSYFDLYYHVLMLVILAKVVLLQEERATQAVAAVRGKGNGRPATVQAS
ncbi:putative O-glycosylation ligase, exosortase A system-associated [Thiobacter aerophilum]|uniref:O-glycosylation ligase, exosortase A system-associated n=1 Tax=Thiobacter aerophilum TaxID=3121275 RepID=A0ABV0EFU0_9BURK